MNRRISSPWRPVRPPEPGDDLRLGFSRELARARRIGKSVSAIAAPTPGADDQARVQTLRLHLRRYDLVGVVDGVVVVLAPEVDRAEAELLRARLESLGAFRWAPRLGLAVAPEDGDSFETIVQIALQLSHVPEGVSP